MKHLAFSFTHDAGTENERDARSGDADTELLDRAFPISRLPITELQRTEPQRDLEDLLFPAQGRARVFARLLEAQMQTKLSASQMKKYPVSTRVEPHRE